MTEGKNKNKLRTTCFKASTSGLEDVIFTFGAASDAAAFNKMGCKLAHYVAMSFKGAGEAKVANDFEKSITLILVKPPPPTDMTK